MMEIITPRPLKAMSEEQLKAFLEAVKADARLQERLKSVVDAEAVVAIANAAGFSFSVEQLKWASTKISGVKELSDNELEGVAGGTENIITLIIKCPGL
jgi:predicted ribosomally synthesized peptide with nif11-like leader